MPLYAGIEEAGALERLEGFASWSDPTSTAPRHDTITLVKQPWDVPEMFPSALQRWCRLGGTHPGLAPRAPEETAGATA